MNTLLVKEIFHSIQGEGSSIGLPTSFIRLSGCNLRCVYCDTAYAFKGGMRMSTEEVIATVAAWDCPRILLTGGEPLLQRPVPELVRTLKERRYEVAIETHGEVSIAAVYENARIIMDIKTPSSGMNRGGFVENLKFITRKDEIKFVIASPEDYSWSKEILSKHSFGTNEILFSPAVYAQNSPGDFRPISPQWLAERILEDRLPVRFQLQLHKKIWGPDRRGV